MPDDQEQAFDAGKYDDPALALDRVDGKAVDGIAIRFSGTVTLDRKNREHVALYRKLILGREVDLGELMPLTGRVVNKPTRQVLDANGYVSDVAQAAVIKVTDVGGFAPVKAPEPSGDAEGE